MRSQLNRWCKDQDRNHRSSKCSVTPCLVTYVTPPFLEKLNPSASFLLDIINLKITTRPLPLAPISILNNANSTAFLKFQVSLCVCVPNEQVRTFPAGSESSPLAWFLHFHHCLTCNQALKDMLTSPGGIGHPLLLLGLFYIEQYILVYACIKLHLLQKLRSHSFNASVVISLISECLQVVVRPEAGCSIRIMYGENLVLD